MLLTALVDLLNHLMQHWEAYVLGALLISAIGFYISEIIEIELVGFVMTTILVLTGILTPEEGMAGFTNRATITVGAMFVLSTAVYRTGALNFFVEFLKAQADRGPNALLIATMVIAGVLSAFINNTAIVAVFIPILLGISIDREFSASKLLIPLSYASLFGGVCTLIGTSTNLLVDSIANAAAGISLHIFEFAGVGLIMFGVGFIYMYFIGKRLLPEHAPPRDITDTEDTIYVTRLKIGDESPFVGEALQDTILEEADNGEVIRVTRGSEIIESPSADFILQPDDLVTIRCMLSGIKALLDIEGLSVPSERGLQADDEIFAEIVVSPASMLENFVFAAKEFRRRTGASIIAIRDRFEAHARPAERIRLKAGDLLLIKTTRYNLERLQQNLDIILVSEHDFPSYKMGQAVTALTIVVGVVLLAAFDALPIYVGAPTGGILLVLTGCLTMKGLYNAIDWKVIFLLAGLIPLGIALQKTGLSHAVSTFLTGSLAAYGPVVVLAALYLITTLMTEIISNNGAVVILAPIAIAAAQTMGVDAKPFVMAVAYAGSASFLTPVGYQTNTMVYQPGGYSFSDYFKVGLPLMLLFWGIAVVAIPIFFPF